ncbi:glycosyltransferase [Candidatus Parcubacteria bacterium]|nr:MAG: glycosyltransferase [Candidatus Parcubacteria bacterium]
MKFSFIIPAYNEAGYIAATIDSILKETEGEQAEIIVVDNNSSDGTAELVKEKYKNIKVVKEKRKGTSFARNRGANEASGEILVFFDADIMVPAGWLEKVKEYLKTSFGVAALGGPYQFSGFNSWQRFWEKAYYILGVMPHHWLLSKVLKIGAVLIGGNCIVKKTAFEKIRGFDEKFTFYGEDANLAKRLLKVGEVKFCLDLFVFSSPRRVMRPDRGILFNSWVGFIAALIYVLNYYSVIIFNRPLMKRHKDFR